MKEVQINLIWKRYVSGDKSAFDVLYNTYYNSLFAYCLGKIKHRESAENAVADVFIRIINYSRPEEIQTPENWMFTIAKNICLNYLNKNNRRNKILNDISWKFETTDNPSTDQHLDMEYVNEQIKSKLKSTDLQIWQMHEEGHDNKSIAEKLQKKEKTVANRKVEIIRKVKEIVEIHLNINGK